MIEMNFSVKISRPSQGEYLTHPKKNVYSRMQRE